MNDHTSTIGTAHRVRPPFSWFGSKSRHLKFLNPLLPVDCKSYAEPFGGSASVLLSRPPVPIETYNDLNGELVNFFRVLRDDFDGFRRLADLTPYSRTEFGESMDIPVNASSLERARLFFLRASTAYAGRSGTSHCYFTTSGWVIRRGMSDRIARYLSAVENLPDIVERFKRVQIENMDALDLIRKYDTPDTLFYCDPPYLTSVRTSSGDYDIETGDVYHRNLADVLNRIEGRAAVSGYDSPLYGTLYSGWMKHVAPINRVCENHAERQEVVWTNYDPSTGERICPVPTVKQTCMHEYVPAAIPEGGDCDE